MLGIYMRLRDLVLSARPITPLLVHRCWPQLGGVLNRTVAAMATSAFRQIHCQSGVSKSLLSLSGTFTSGGPGITGMARLDSSVLTTTATAKLFASCSLFASSSYLMYAGRIQPRFHVTIRVLATGLLRRANVAVWPWSSSLHWPR